MSAARFITPLLVLLLVMAGGLRAEPAGSAHDFDFISIDGEPMPMAGYRGKAVLLVNTASFCGFTHQYGDLQTVWQRYRDQGLVVVGVPSNDSGGQEPNADAEIKEFCEVNFDVDFPLTEKQQVRGADAHPLYRWLKAELGPQGEPRWNFHKILIAADGRAITGWPSPVKPTDARVTGAIEAALAEAATTGSDS